MSEQTKLWPSYPWRTSGIPLEWTKEKNSGERLTEIMKTEKREKDTYSVFLIDLKSLAI